MRSMTRSPMRPKQSIRAAEDELSDPRVGPLRAATARRKRRDRGALEARARLDRARTGSDKRRYAGPGEALSDMAAVASEKALNRADIERSRIALTLLATSTPDHLLPPSAPLLAHRLGLTQVGRRRSCRGVRRFSLRAGAGRRVRARARGARARGGGKRAVATHQSGRARELHPFRRRSGRGSAGAVAAAGMRAARRSPRRGRRRLRPHQDRSRRQRRPFATETPLEDTLMTIPDGQAVFSQAVDLMVKSSREALRKAGLTIADIDWLVPHQANARIMAAVATKLGLPEAKMVSTVAHSATARRRRSRSRWRSPSRRGESAAEIASSCAQPAPGSRAVRSSSRFEPGRRGPDRDRANSELGADAGAGIAWRLILP